MTDVFLSYKAEDRPRVLPLVKSLEEDGLAVWWDAHITGGDQWRETILRRLESAGCVAVVWSRRSTGPKGEFVRDEAMRAKRLGTYLPVRIDKVEPPLGFGETQSLDLIGWKGDRTDPRYLSLLSAVQGRLGIGQAKASRPGPGSTLTTRRAALAGGAVAAAAAAGFGTWMLVDGKPAHADTIAVLPFANLSGDPAQAYLADGIAEELRGVLARIPGIRVVARTSSEAVRDAGAQSAAAKLRVQNILTGSVRRSASTIRVSAQLVDGRDGTQRWSEVYDRRIGDSLTIQTEIANRVSQALSIQLGATELRALNEGGTTNPTAQDLLLRAQGILWRNDDRPALQSALELIDSAISLDPRYVDALTGKASILAFDSALLAADAADMNAKAAQAEVIARQAVRFAPRSPQARGALAKILWQRLKLRAGFAQFIEMGKLRGPTTSYFNNFDPLALALWQCRRLAEAIRRADRLIATDPLNPNSYVTKALIIGQSGRPADADQLVRQAMQLSPELIWPRAFHAFFLMLLGRLDEAQAAFGAIEGAGPWSAWAAVAALRNGQPAEAARHVGEMGQAMGDAAYYQFAQVFAQQARQEDALKALEKGWATRDAGLTFLQVDPMFAPLREHPRFQELVRRLDFPS